MSRPRNFKAWPNGEVGIPQAVRNLVTMEGYTHARSPCRLGGHLWLDIKNRHSGLNVGKIRIDMPLEQIQFAFTKFIVARNR